MKGFFTTNKLLTAIKSIEVLTNSLGKESCITKMAENTRVGGRMDCTMDRVFYTIEMDLFI